jgi:uncharacterized protein YybS (DUF2232 family)
MTTPQLPFLTISNIICCLAWLITHVGQTRKCMSLLVQFKRNSISLKFIFLLIGEGCDSVLFFFLSPIKLYIRNLRIRMLFYTLCIHLHRPTALSILISIVDRDTEMRQSTSKG